MKLSGRQIFALVFLAVSVVGMVARYQYQKAEQRKREQMLRTLSNLSRDIGRERFEGPTPEPTIDEKRGMFDGELPQEYMAEIMKAAGDGAKLMEVHVSDMGLSAKVSNDGATVKEYRYWKGRKSPEGPFEVKIIGDGKVSDNLMKPADIDLALVPKMAKEAYERADFPDSKVDGARLYFPLFRQRGQGPEWYVNLSAKRGEKWEFKNVTFDAKGKFKAVN